MGSFNHFDDPFPDEFDSQGFLHAPTPGVFGGPDSDSPFPGYRSTSSPVQHEVPRTPTPCIRPRPQTEKLALLRLSEWDPAKVYDDDSPTYLRVTIGWKVIKNRKLVHETTEQNVVLALATYWELILQPKVEKTVATNLSQRRKMVLLNTKVVVSVTQRLEPKLILQYNKDEEIHWPTVESKLVEWGEFFRAGKKLRLDLSVNYDDREGAGQQATTGLSTSVDKRSTRSTTQQMLTDLHAEQEASGRAAVYSRIYHLFECPSLSCNSPNYCWVDHIFGNIHRKINTRLLGKVIKHALCNDLTTHRDVPGDLQEEIRMEDQQRNNRKRKAIAISPHNTAPVNITNVMPGHSELALLQPQAASAPPASGSKPANALEIPGFRDDAVKDYVEFLKSKVRSQKHREEFEKAGNIVLDDLLDLDQVYNEHKVEFFTSRRVKLAPAKQFIRDIPLFVQHRQVSQN